MNDDPPKKRVVAEVDEDAKEILDEKLAHGELSELIRDVVNTVAFGDGWDRRTVLDRRIEAKREDIEALRAKRRDINAKIETAENDLKTLQQKRERIETKDEQYAGALWSFEQSFRAGEVGHIYPKHSRIHQLAEEYNKDREDVFDELRERNPDVPDHAFVEVGKADWKFTGLDESVVATPVDDRSEVGGE